MSIWFFFIFMCSSRYSVVVCLHAHSFVHVSSCVFRAFDGSALLFLVNVCVSYVDAFPQVHCFLYVSIWLSKGSWKSTVGFLWDLTVCCICVLSVLVYDIYLFCLHKIKCFLCLRSSVVCLWMSMGSCRVPIRFL